MQLINRSSKQETMKVLPSCWIKEMSRGHVSTNQSFFASRGPWAPIARNEARDHFPRVRALTTCWTNGDCKTAVRFVYVSRKLGESVTSLTTAEKDWSEEKSQLTDFSNKLTANTTGFLLLAVVDFAPLIDQITKSQHHTTVKFFHFKFSTCYSQSVFLC